MHSSREIDAASEIPQDRLRTICIWINVIKQLGAIDMIHFCWLLISFCGFFLFLRSFRTLSPFYLYILLWDGKNKSKPICSINESFHSPHDTAFCPSANKILYFSWLLLIFDKLSMKWNQSIYKHMWGFSLKLQKLYRKVIIIDFVQLKYAGNQNWTWSSLETISINIA